MSKAANKNRVERPVLKSSPIPVRLTEIQLEDLLELGKATGMNRVCLIRMALDFCLPRLRNGDIDIRECGRIARLTKKAA